MHISSRARWVAAAVALLTTAACSSAEPGQGDSGPVRVGALLPFSGEAAFLGENVGSKGAALAVRVANANGGVLGHDVELVNQDDRRTPQGAVSGLRVLQSKKVTVAIGPTSAEIPAVMSQLKQADTPWIPVGGTTLLDKGLQGSHVWRTFPSDTQAVPAMLLAAAKRGGRIGLVFENNATGQQLMTAAKRFAQVTPGITLVNDVLLAPGQPSYRSEASQFFRQDYDAVLWQLVDASAAGFFKSASQLGALEDQYFLGTDAATEDSILDILKPYLGKAEFAAVGPAQAGPGKTEFAKLYREHFDSEPVVYADFGYDATTLLLLAVEQADTTDPARIAEAVPKVAAAPGEKCTSFATCVKLIRAGTDVDFDGAANSLELNEHHNVVAPFALSAVKANGSVTGSSTAAFSLEEIGEILDKGQG